MSSQKNSKVRAKAPAGRLRKGCLQDPHASGLRVGADQSGDGVLPELQEGPWRTSDSLAGPGRSPGELRIC